MKTKFLLITITAWLTLVPQLIALPADDDKLIEGNWLIVEAQLGGQKMPDEGLKDHKLSLKDGKYSFDNDHGEYKIDPKTKIKSIDISGTEGPNKGRLILAIYELQDDTLKICYDLEGKGRPKEFTSKSGTKQFLVTYRREKE